MTTLTQKVNQSRKKWIGNYSELWKFDRQFCGTVYVISWTVALILSTRKIVNLEHVFVSFQDFVGKTRNFSVWILARFSGEGEYTYHRRFGHMWNWTVRDRVFTTVQCMWLAPVWYKSQRHLTLDIEILFIDELLVISESRTVTYSWMGGIRRIGKLRINGLVSRSVIYLSGSTQGSEFWVDLLKVSSSLETFRFLWWIVIIIGNN